jgi:hypothetical protein
MAIAQHVFETGRQVADAGAVEFPGALLAGIERLVGWPYETASSNVIDRDGAVSDTFAAVVYVAKKGAPDEANAHIPADLAAVVVDAIELTIRSSSTSASGRTATVG